MTKESKIRLLTSKLCVFKSGYDRAVAKEDSAAASIWKESYYRTQERIDTLKEDL